MAAVEDRLRIEYVPTEALRPYQGNPRKMSERGLEKLRRSVEKFGFLNPILVQQGTNMIIAGHQRLKAAQAAGLTEVPVVWLDMDDVTAKAYNIADNRLQDEAEWDFTPLADLLTELDTGAFDLTLTGFDTDELEQMMNYTPAGEVQEDEVPEPPEEPVTKPGDIWQLGRHRVMCGDSTDPDHVARLLAGKQIDLVLTDPPYGVAYTGKTAEALEIENDQLDEEGLAKLIHAAFDEAEAHSRPGAYWYATVPPGPLHLVFAADWKRRGVLRQIMVWVKDAMVLGHSEYHYKHEPILFGWIPGERHRNADRTRTTVWEYPRPKASREHPTMKPVALWAQAICDGSIRGESVYDPFLGSGTTVVAAEQLDRICYGMEIDPRYCDVIVKRWEQLTGKEAELVQNQ